MSMWEVLASDSSGDEEDEQSTSCSRSSSGTSNTSSASSDSESEVDRFAGAGFPGYEPSKRDQAEDVVRGVSPTIMDEVALEFMTSTPTNQRFRRSKKKKQKMMRRRTRHLHDSFALLERKTQRVSAGGLDEGDAVRHTDFLPSDNSDDSLSSSASDSRKSCSMPTKESTSLPPSKHSSATNEEPLHHYRHDLSVNCVFLLTSEEFSSVPLCPDHSGAFRSWAQAVLRESSFGDIAVVVNQHRARLAALASPDAQDESGSTNSKSAFDAWVAAEKARRVEAQRAAENVLVVYNSSKERVSVSDEAAATTLLDSTLRDTPGFALKSDANGCCACSCPTLNAKKRRAGTREALTTTSFPFLGAYMCYRLVHLLRAPLKQLCKIPAGPGRRLNSSAEDDTLHKTRNGNSGHRSSSKNITHHNKHHHLPQPNTCKPRRSSNSNSTSSSSSAHSSDFDDASDHHVESSSFFIDSSGNVVIVAPQDSAEHALQADDDRDGDAGETDMWGVSFKGACQPPMSAAEAAVQAAAGSVLRAHTCAVCMEVLCHPCSLRRCGHIFCRGCLLSMLYSAARAAEFNEIPPFCPLCRTDFRASDVIHDRFLDSRLVEAYPVAYAAREPECAVLEERLAAELFGDASSGYGDSLDFEDEDDADLFNTNDHLMQLAIEAQLAENQAQRIASKEKKSSSSAKDDGTNGKADASPPPAAATFDQHSASATESPSAAPVVTSVAAGQDSPQASAAGAAAPPNSTPTTTLTRQQLRSARLKYFSGQSAAAGAAVH